MNRSNFIRNSLMTLAISMVPEILRPVSNPVEDLPGIGGETFTVKVQESSWMSYAESVYWNRWYNAAEHSIWWRVTPEEAYDRLYSKDKDNRDENEKAQS